MLKKIICIVCICIAFLLLPLPVHFIIEKAGNINGYEWLLEHTLDSDQASINMYTEKIEKLQKEILTLVICSVSLVSCAALIIAYPLRFSFKGYREKYDAWVQRRKEAAFQRKYRKAKKNMEQEKKKLEKMEKEKAGK